MFKIFSLLLIVFGASFQVSAQCGVYFKESNRQVFSNSFANGYFDDFDNDGLKDLLGYSLTQTTSGGPLSIQLQYYKRLSENSFDTTARSSLIPTTSAWFGVFGDVNADGKKDVIVTQFTNPVTLTTYLNDGTGRFLTTTPAVNISGEYVHAASDLNNDGKADVVTLGGFNPPFTLYYRLAQPDNSFGSPVAITTVSSFLQLPDYYDDSAGMVTVDDLNNDGAKDIAYISGFGQQAVLHVLTNNGSLAFTETHTEGLFAEPTTKLRTYDLNNDGKKDFISNPRPWQTKLLVNNGNNTFTTSIYNLPFTNTYDSYLTKDFHVADFDNDGDTDVLYPGSKGYVLLRNQGNLTFVQEQFKSLLSMDSVANLDGDGKADAVLLIRPLIDGAYRTYDGNNYRYYYLHNAVSFRKNVCNPVGQTKIVDFDGDGFTDRAFWNPVTGVWRYYTERSTFSTAQSTFQWGTQGDLPVPNDYDGDGQTDYAVFRRSTGAWWIYRSSDQQAYGQSFGITEDKPVPADYDGDGKADIAVFRPSTGDWHLWLSQTSQYSSIHFGTSEDKPLPADYDGDGKADISVFRPSTGVWYRINSSDNSVAFVQYGLGTDRPVPGDYDGDGKANIAVYRNGAWYVLRDNLSTSVLNFGIADDLPFFDDASGPSVGVYRRTTTSIYTSAAPVGLFGLPWPTGNSSNETFVSSILPPE